MKKLFLVSLLLFVTCALQAQDYAADLKDCTKEKDEVFIDWTKPVNKKYAERIRVEKFEQKRLRSFYCQNLVARDQLETEGMVHSEGSFQLTDDEEKYLIFSIKMGDLTYQDKLFIHIGPRQKLITSNRTQ